MPLVHTALTAWELVVLPTQACKVVVIDDDAAVLDSLRFLLEVSGHDVATFHSGAEYLAAGGSANCLIIDHHMPNMTGLELVAQLTPEVPRESIVLITGSSTDAIRERAETLGIAKVLDKPPEDDELLDFVATCAVRPAVPI